MIGTVLLNTNSYKNSSLCILWNSEITWLAIVGNGILSSTNFWSNAVGLSLLF